MVRQERLVSIIVDSVAIIMKINLRILLLALFAGLMAAALVAQAQDDTNKIPPQVLEIVNNLKYQHGDIDLQGGLAKLSLPADFKYLGPDDTETVLVKLWGNPPSETKLLGLIMPAGLTPLDSNCWVVTIEYTADGYVKDSDAAKINYDDLLKKMQKGMSDDNVKRQKDGYPALTLVGWAAPPHYDADSHKLYWAMDIKAEGEEGDSLNYNIRMLGRHGVLVLNVLADISQFSTIDKQTPQILSMVDFKDGNRYADFDPKTDKVAKYGIAALVAGGALATAAKLGLLKGLWVAILALKKFLIIGVLAIAAFFKKLFNRGGSSSGGTPST
jgi:uncharacterized membrane-anchored protein